MSVATNDEILRDEIRSRLLVKEEDRALELEKTKELMQCHAKKSKMATVNQSKSNFRM